MEDAQLPVALLGSLLFSMIGPVQVIPLFAAATAGLERTAQIRTAFAATAIAGAALSLAVTVGASAMASAGTSRASLIIAAGVILMLTALQNIFGGAGRNALVEQGKYGLALSPIAIPGLATPIGVAILIIFSSYFRGVDHKLTMLGVTASILALDLLAMLCATWFMRVVGMAPLVLLGAVFGVLQAAMGVEMVMSGFVKSPLFR